MAEDADWLMRHAIEAAQRGIRNLQSPFGCAIARDGELLVACHNLVWQNKDITAHAEITALRQACAVAGQILLSDCVVATTCEPCPMCATALHWARVPKVYYGATITDAKEAGFNELDVKASELLRQGKSRVELVGSVLADQCRGLFAEWRQAQGESY